MSRPRLTRQRYEALVEAMAFVNTDIEEEEIDGSSDPQVRERRRHYESAMVWLNAMADQAGVR